MKVFNLSEWALRHRSLVWYLMIVSTIVGVASYRSLVREEDPEQVIVGHPLTLSGERGEQARETEAFADKLRGVVDVPVLLWDERFTTDLAQQTPSASSLDARAAAHLLSGYLAWSSGAPA